MAQLPSNRREALFAMGGLAAATVGTSTSTNGYAATALPATHDLYVRFSRGTEIPKTKVPANACDCHHHIYDARFPPTPTATLLPADALVQDYRDLQQRIGTTRHVIIQPSTYGVDNELMIQAIAAFGQQTCRGVAVVNDKVSDAELQRLHQAGVRGIRFNLAPPGTTTLDMVKPLAARIAAMGWHIQLNAPADALLAAKSLWSDLPVPCVFDHLARIPEPDAINHPNFAMMRDLLQKGNTYVKLSGFYIDSKIGHPTYADSVKLASAFAKEAPERMLWGSDWPHPTEGYYNKPNDANLLDCFAQAVPDEAIRHRILVDNPARLYQFT